MNEKHLVTVGIISYKDQKYLIHAISSLLSQTYQPLKILISDNNPERTIFEWIIKEFHEVEVFYQNFNLGFAKAHNYLIQKALGKYYLAFNSDMLADRDFVKELVKEIEKDPKIACVTGKLLRWSNFPQNPRLILKQTIDTTGLVIFRNHHVLDRGQNDLDQGQFDHNEEIWGASGAAPLYRISALKDVAYNKNEYFDEDFFMYKEDIDLSYRLRWAGWKTIYTYMAVAWHDRTAYNPGGIIKMIKKRRSQSQLVREKSFLNHLFFLYKNVSCGYALFTKISISLFMGKYMIYLLLFESSILRQLFNFVKLRAKMRDKAARLKRRISVKKMEFWFR